jgi:radical SAM protein with 4Fe4S-binding SPASM domain
MVSKYNYKNLIYIAELAKKCKATTLKLQPFSKIFLDKEKNSEEFFISNAETIEAGRIIKGLIAYCNINGIGLSPVSYLEKIPVYLSGQHPGLTFACPAPLISCPINAKGEVYPCWVITGKDNLIGNIKDAGLEKLWNSRKRQSIINKIKKEGCSGCVMSCYDDNFGSRDLEARIALNIGRLKRYGFREYIRSSSIKWAKRIKFYLGYRGPLKTAIKRAGRLLFKQRLPDRKDGIIEKVLREIDLSKQILKNELKCQRPK